MRLVAAVATAPDEVQLGFDVPVEVTDRASATFAATTSPAVPLSAVAWSANGPVVTLSVAPTMTPAALYQVQPDFDETEPFEARSHCLTRIISRG